MATVNPTRDASPAFPSPEGLAVFSATIADADDLVLPKVSRVALKASPSAATTTLNSISDGQFPGQEAIVMVVVTTNVLRIPGALGNVDLGATVNLDVSEEANARLVWDGAAWRNV